MANWSDLKAAVAEVIKTNSNQEITGAVLQNVLNNIISNVGENASFVDVATPSTNPGTPDGNVFYFAIQPGIYSNFGGVTLTEGLNILLWNGSIWSADNLTKSLLNNINSNTGVDDYPVFSTSEAYSKGKVVNYNGKLYKFTADHAAGAWTGMDVEPYNLKKDIEERYGTYTDNPEFIRVYTDAEGKFLWGIRVDGSVEWSKGVPTPVQNALKELADKIKDAIDVINASLKTLTDTFSYQDNPEFVNVVTDAEGKVLFGIKEDGKPYFPKNTMYSVESNQEFLAAWLDAAGHVLFGLRTDGSTYVAKADFIEKIEKIQQLLKDNGIGDFNNTFSIISNDEWLHAVVDSENKLLFGIRAKDGKVVMPKQDTYNIISNDEWLAAWVDKSDKLLFGVKADGTFWAAKSNFAGSGNYDEQIAQLNEEIQQLKDQIQATASDVFFVIDDAEERLAITTDKDERIISYRDKDGVLHEKKGVDTSKYYLNGEEKDFTDRSEIAGEVTKAAENGAVKLENVEGVSNHNTPNLLIASEMEKTFNDGTNSFTPPNEGYEMSNPIECQAGDWFTRTGIATGMVVVTDAEDKNGTRLFNADGTTLGNTFQIPKDMTWVRYIRMAAQVSAAEDGSVVICKGKYAYTGNDKGDFLTASKLRIERRNLSNDVAYIKSEDGTKFYKLYVDASGTLKTKEIDPDVIPENEYPTNWLPVTFSGSFEDYCDRIPICTKNYLMDIKATGPVKIYTFDNQLIDMYNNFEHFYNSTGEGRYGIILFQVPTGYKSGFFLFDEDFNILENIRSVGDMHDFVYIDDDHLIFFTNYLTTVNGGGVENAKIYVVHVTEMKKVNGEWKTIGTFNQEDYPKLCTDCYGDLGGTEGGHINTIGLDYDGNLIINQRNWDTFFKIKRTENPDGTVTIGSKTLDYDEAIIGRVGGRHNSAYLDSKRVLNEGFSFTDIPSSLSDVSADDWEEWQWFHCHDVKYWGKKNIDGVDYPTYTLFDNNYWTGATHVSGGYNATNKNNNYTINPNGDGGSYLQSKDSDSNYAKYTHSRVIQITIDWENHKVKDYRVYIIPKLYGRETCGAVMFDEGVICIAYGPQGIFGIWDFTTEETDVQGHIYTGAKEVFKAKYDTYRGCYRANAYKLKN